MPLTEQIKSAQSSLAKYCRTGSLGMIPGINPKHVTHYRRLVYNIIDDSLRSAYPLTNQMLGEEAWDQLVDEFFREHPCKSPQVWRMPEELYQYITATKHILAERYRFLPELMRMEWLEVELYMMDDIHVPHHLKNISGNDKLVINTEHRLLHFIYPVHLKNAGGITEADKGNYFLSMHRDPQTGKVIFNDLSIFFFRMMENLSAGPAEAAALIEETSAGFGIPVDHIVRAHAEDFIDKSIQNNLIIGYTN